MYNLVPKAKIAMVTQKEKKETDNYGNEYVYSDYSGSIIIPSTITVKGTTYSVVGIEQNAFSGSSVTSVTIPNSVKTIGANAFSNSGLTSIPQFPESITSIPIGCFSYCSRLTSITIPNSVTSIGEMAFYQCSNLTSVTIPNTVTNIDDGAFRDCSSLISFTFPHMVTIIPYECFRGCSNLTSVIIPNSVTSIGEMAFMYCSKLSSVAIPNAVTSIGKSAFEFCSSLTSVIMGNSIKTIGGSAFYGCSSLTSITIPGTITDIPSCCFSGCCNLTSVTVPESVKGIGDCAFEECSSLTSIVLFDVNSIGEAAFYDCTSLRSVVLKGELDWEAPGMGHLAFANCTQLEDFTFESHHYVHRWDDATENYIKTSEECAYFAVHSDAFENSYVQYATLYVPESAISLYKGFSPWSQFGTITSLGSASQYYKLFVDVNDKGKVVYGEGEFAKTITGASQTFDVKEQEDIVLTLTPNEGYKLGTVTVNGVDKTAAVVDGVLTITDVNANQNVNVEFVMDGTSVAVTIGELGIATFCSEEALDFSGTEEVKAYIVSAFRPSTGKVTLTRITDVPARTGIVLLGNAGTYDIPLGAGETYVVNMLVGVTEPTVLNKTEGANSNFILANDENGLGFYAVSNGTTLAAGKAYLTLPTSVLPSNAQSIGLRFDGTTGIRSLDNGQMTIENSEWFTIDGRRLDAEPSTKGLYIVNGRKVFVK